MVYQLLFLKKCDKDGLVHINGTSSLIHILEEKNDAAAYSSIRKIRLTLKG